MGHGKTPQQEQVRMSSKQVSSLITTTYTKVHTTVTVRKRTSPNFEWSILAGTGILVLDQLKTRQICLVFECSISLDHCRHKLF
jgi:hypothetical protein